MFSMTGFASYEKKIGDIYWDLKISTINSKYLEINIDGIRDLYLQDLIRKELKEQIHRGKVVLQIRYKVDKDKNMASKIDDDILFLTADHGCDPTWPGNDHTREFVPLLAYHHNIQTVDLGQRTSFADLGQTLADLFKVESMAFGISFLKELKAPRVK